MSRFMKIMAGSVMIATCLMGCAVLRVDVDVYKGRLSLKTKPYDMVAGSLMGSKTILVDLRDRLWTWGYRDNDRVLSILRRQKEYKTSMIPLDDLKSLFDSTEDNVKRPNAAAKGANGVAETGADATVEEAKAERGASKLESRFDDR